MAAVVTALGGALLCGDAFAQTHVRIGLIGTNESQLPILIAIDKGYFKDEHLDVETENFSGGGVAVQAFVGGSIDLASFATDHALLLNSRGTQTRFLIGIDRYITHTLVVPIGKGYVGLASLKGKKIGVTAPASYSDNVLRWSLLKAGINPDRDVTIVSVGDGNTAKAALLSGRVDAVMASTPDVLDYQINDPGKTEILYDWRKIPHSGQAVIGLQKWITAHPDAARGVARAVLKAEQTVQTDPDEVRKIIRKQFPNQTDAYIDAYAKIVPDLLSKDGRISKGGYLKMVEIMQTIEPSAKPIDQSQVDLTDQLLGR
ncbi:ABC transporter substrate-binding protein [Pararobbsia silviterrae]|nr:ABC transporter substrate-binding protein [Pararobbsia silviterrae]